MQGACDPGGGLALRVKKRLHSCEVLHPETSSKTSTQQDRSLFISKQLLLLLLGGTHGAVFAAEVMHHHAVWIPGKRTVSYLLLADSAGLLLGDDTLRLLVEDPLLLHPEELCLQQALQDLVAAFPLSPLLQDALQEHADLSDLSVSREQVDGLGGVELAVVQLQDV